MIDLRATALRALQFIDEGRSLAAALVDEIETADLKTSNALVYQLDRALVAVATGHHTLHSIMSLMAAQHQCSTLPSEDEK